MISWGPKSKWSAWDQIRQSLRRLFTLPDQVAREGSHLWEDGVVMDTSTISRTNVCDSEDSFCQTTMVDWDEFAVRELPKAEEGIHEELIIHSLEVQVWGILYIVSSPCRQGMTKGTLPSSQSGGSHIGSNQPGRGEWRDQSLAGPVPGSSGGGDYQPRSHCQLLRKGRGLLTAPCSQYRLGSPRLKSAGGWNGEPWGMIGWPQVLVAVP